MSRRLFSLALAVVLVTAGTFALHSSVAIHADDDPEQSCASPSPSASPEPSASPSATSDEDESNGCPGNSQAAHECPHDDGDDTTHGDHGQCVSQAAHTMHAS